MEVSVIQSSQSKVLSTEHRELGFCGSRFHGVRALNSRTNLCFARSWKWNNARLRFASPQAVQSGLVQPKEASDSSPDRVKLFVGLPLDVISSCNSVNHSRPIVAGLKILKLLGVEGVEVPVWWGQVEKDSIGQYEWLGYNLLFEMIQNAGLKCHVSLNFHGSSESDISIPNWVSRVGRSDPNIYFADRAGQRYKDCLSLGVDDIPVLDGKTPVQVYRDFCESFKSSVLSSFGSTISGATIGLGPDGELRYPSHHHKPPKGTAISGAGEFQCYDKHMLESLRRHAESAGTPLWGLSGPHDAPGYDQAPSSARFFTDLGGSWETPYGHFFLSWYSGQLSAHGSRVLSAASSALPGVEIFGRVPVLDGPWSGMRSRPAELAGGYYNTCLRDGYDPVVAEAFTGNSCKVVLRFGSLSGRPESVIGRVGSACERHQVGILGQDSAAESESGSGSGGGFGRIQKHLLGDKLAESFIYDRMGVHFFSPEHFPSFSRFVRVLNQPELYDPVGDEDFERVSMVSGSRTNMQAA